MQRETMTCTLKDTTVIEVAGFLSLFTKWHNTGIYFCPDNGYSDIFYARLMQTKTMSCTKKDTAVIGVVAFFITFHKMISAQYWHLPFTFANATFSQNNSDSVIILYGMLM